MQRESKNFTAAGCAQAIVLQVDVWSYRRISDRFGVSHTSISRMIERYRETGEHIKRTDRYLRLSALRQRFATTRMLQSQLQNAHGLRVSLETVRQRLLEDDLISRIAAREPVLTVDLRRAWLNFARENAN